MRAEFDEREDGLLARRCVETREEQRGNNLLKLAIERVPSSVIAGLEAQMRAEVEAARLGGAASTTAASGMSTQPSADIDVGLFSDGIEKEFASGHVTGKPAGKKSFVPS